MSQFVEVKTEFLDKECLIEAIKELKINPKVGENMNLYGYHGDMRKDTADIIIDRSYIGSSSNDLGFKLENGKYKMIISEFDKKHKSTLDIVDKITQNYGKNKVIKECTNRGFSINTTKEKDGSYRINVKKVKTQVRI